jgi:hypothetical protein
VGVGGGIVSVGGAAVAVGAIAVKVAVASGKGASVGGAVGAGGATGLVLHAMAIKTSNISKDKRLIMKSTPCVFLNG